MKPSMNFSSSTEPARFESALNRLKASQVPWVPYPALLSFLATTSKAGSLAKAGIVQLDRIGPGKRPHEAEVYVRGRFPAALAPGDSITASVSRYERFHGYQIKTTAVCSGSELEALEPGPDCRFIIHGRRTYTTHHGPYEVNFFERIPFDEIQRQIGGHSHAVIAVGPGVNVSPRLLFHHDVAGGALVTYHGDGVMMKTYRNLAVNNRAVQLVFDLVSLRGYALIGTCSEVPPEQHQEAYRHVCAGWAALGFGLPTRLFRHRCEAVKEIAVASS